MNTQFSGVVVSGHGRGRHLSFPTLNLKVSDFVVEEGVYAVYADLEGRVLDAVMHVGPRPTFHEEDPSIEVHLLDFEEDFIPKQITIDVLGRLRDIQSFDSSEALKKQIEQDIMQAHANYFQTQK